jgi:hypothetical protein
MKQDSSSMPKAVSPNNFFLTIPQAIAQDRSFRPIDRLVLGHLAGRTNGANGVCDSTLQQLAEAGGCCRSTVLRSLRRLEGQGRLTIGRMPLPRPRRGNRYFYRLQESIWQLFLEAWGLIATELKALGRRVAEAISLSRVLSDAFLQKLPKNTGVRRSPPATDAQMFLPFRNVAALLADPRDLDHQRGVALLPNSLARRLGFVTA